MLSVIEALVQDLTRDVDGRVADGQRTRAISQAFARYQSDRALEKATFLTDGDADEFAKLIPRGEHEAVASYAAALLLRQLANFHAANSDIDVQGVARADHADKSDIYARRAKELEARYFEALGLSADRRGDTAPDAAATVVHWKEPRSS